MERTAWIFNWYLVRTYINVSSTYCVEAQRMGAHQTWLSQSLGVVDIQQPGGVNTGTVTALTTTCYTCLNLTHLPDHPVDVLY